CCCRCWSACCAAIEPGRPAWAMPAQTEVRPDLSQENGHRPTGPGARGSVWFGGYYDDRGQEGRQCPGEVPSRASVLAGICATISSTATCPGLPHLLWCTWRSVTSCSRRVSAPGAARPAE